MDSNEVLCLKWNNHKSIFLQNLSSLRSQELYSDATLTCNGKYFSVHRLVLSTCSEYFEEMFEKMNRQNVHPFIIITHIESPYLEALLNFMYNGEVNVLHEMLPGLMKAAEILKIKGLAVPDQESEKELNNFHEAEENTSSVDPKGNLPKSPVNHISTLKNQLVEENFLSDQNHCTFEDGSTHSDISLPSNIENVNKNIDGNRFQPKEEFFEMYSVESSKETISSSSDSIIYHQNILERGNREAVKEEVESVDQNAMQSRVSSNIFSEHIPPPQHFASNVTLTQRTLSQNFINSEEHVSYNHSSVVHSEKEQDIEFEIDQPNEKIHGLLLHTETEKPTATSSRNCKYLRNSETASFSSRSLKKRNTSIGTSSPVSKKCPKCSYVTKYVSTLRRHIMFKHTGEKPHQCHFCPYRSAHNFNMKKHMMIHTGEKPFSCPLCPYKASQNSNIKAHMKCHEKKLMKVAIKGIKRGKQ